VEDLRLGITRLLAGEGEDLNPHAVVQWLFIEQACRVSRLIAQAAERLALLAVARQL